MLTIISRTGALCIFVLKRAIVKYAVLISCATDSSPARAGLGPHRVDDHVEANGTGHLAKHIFAEKTGVIRGVKLSKNRQSAFSTQ